MTLNEYETTLAGASHWSTIIRKGMQLNVTDIQGGGNLGMLLFNPTMLSEKYNAPDTLKCQHTFKLSKGNCLYSEMGRIFCSIIDDSFGWHETVCGNSHASHVEQRWGKRSYQNDSNLWHQNGYDSFIVELAKYHLSPRDMCANINWFSHVSSTDEGKLALTKRSKAGDNITLRFEMDTLAFMHTCPHPLNEDSAYPNKPIKLHFCKAAPVLDDDYCMNYRLENQRGFKNNALYHMGMN